MSKNDVGVESNLSGKIANATKWSAVTEIVAKIVSPISSMILARVLAPEAFGVVVTATMVLVFVKIFADGGFQEYIIQHNFDSEEDLAKFSAVAFWSNLIFALVFFFILVIFSSEIAAWVGSPGYGEVIAVTSLTLPLTVLSSMQMAMFRRRMDFRSLFFVRLVGSLTPIVVTVPLAFVMRSYWALVIGMIAKELVNVVALTVQSRWLPRLYFSFRKLKEMLSFTGWIIAERFSAWISGYADIFFLGVMMNAYYLGIYRTSITVVGSIMSVVTSAMVPVLFSALSRLQDDGERFKKTFFRFQKVAGLFLIPLGVGIYLYREWVTEVLLGSQWVDAVYIIGLWGLADSLIVVLSHFCGSVFKAKGKPEYMVISKSIYFVFLIPTVVYFAGGDFSTFCLARILVRFVSVVSDMALMYHLVRFSPLETGRNLFAAGVGALAMVAFYCFMPAVSSLPLVILSCFLCALVYLLVISMFKTERTIVLDIFRRRNVFSVE